MKNLEENTIIDLDIPIRICIDFTNHKENFVLTPIAIDPNNPLPLVYLELIDWDQTTPYDKPIFENDDAIIKFIFFDNLETSSNHEIHNEASR